jgi:hypothetical protein
MQVMRLDDKAAQLRKELDAVQLLAKGEQVDRLFKSMCATYDLE